MSRHLESKLCSRCTSNFHKSLCKICIHTIPHHLFFGTRLPRSSVLWVLVLASEGTVYLCSRSTFFLPHLIQQICALSSSSLCPFRLNTLSLPTIQSSTLQCACHPHEMHSNAPCLYLGFLVCEGRTMVLTHLFQALWYVWRNTNLIHLHFQMQNYYYYC